MSLFFEPLTPSLVVVCLVVRISSAEIRNNEYTKDIFCDLEGRLAQSCVTAKSGGFYTTTIACILGCEEDNDCLGVSADIDQTCYHYRSCADTFSCGKGSDIYGYSKRTSDPPNTRTAKKTTLATEQTTLEVVTTTTTFEETKPPTTTPYCVTPLTSEVTTPTPTPDVATPPTSEVITKHIQTLTASSPAMLTTSTNLAISSAVQPTSDDGPVCRNSGVWNQTANRCNCSNGWVGSHCERRPSSCQDLIDANYTTGLTYWVDLQVDGLNDPVKVKCILQNTYLVMLILNNKGMKNHTKSYGEYLKGYFIDKYHYWLGLAAMKKFNDAGYETVYLDISFFPQFNSLNIFQYRYEQFELGPAPDFKFTYSSAFLKQTGTYSSKLTPLNCLDSLKGAPFCVYDRYPDNDSSKNCAWISGVGWWYDGCTMKCNPLGWAYEGTLTDIPVEKRFKMAGLDLKDNNYAKWVNIAMYFLVSVT